MKYCNYCMNAISEDQNPCPHCGRTGNEELPAHHLKPGTVLNGKFQVGIALGEGGFGITYVGRDILLDMKVAIKEYFPNGCVNRTGAATQTVSICSGGSHQEFFDKGRERFLKEARMLAKFSGELGVVDVRDFFEENNTAYIVMEYLEGQTLKSYINQAGLLSCETTLNLLMPVMNSLQKVHQTGLIHRDISPDNIMLLADGKVKLLDFGAARDVSNGNKSLSVMLKPGYAPEEQYRSKGVQGPWTDVYALCATIYKCITGVTPDDSTQRVFEDEVRLPSEMGIAISPTFEAALMKGLAVLQKDRYQSIDELLAGFAGQEVVTRQPAFVGAGAGEQPIGFEPMADDEKTLGAFSDLPVYGGPAAPENLPVYPEAPQPAEMPQPQVKQKGKKKPILLLAGIIVVIALIVGIVIFSKIGPINGTWTGEHPDYDEYSIKFNDLKKTGTMYMDDDAYAFKYSLEDDRLFVAELDDEFFEDVYYEVEIDGDTLTITDFIGEEEDDFFEVGNHELELTK